MKERSKAENRSELKMSMLILLGDWEVVNLDDPLDEQSNRSFVTADALNRSLE